MSTRKPTASGSAGATPPGRVLPYCLRRERRSPGSVHHGGLAPAERLSVKIEDRLPEVTLLYDARGPRPENAVGIGEFWYEPEIWSLPLSPAPKVLYASLCSYLGHGQINRKDLRTTLKGHSDEEIAEALEDLAHHGLLVAADKATGSGVLQGYNVQSVKEFGG